MSCCLLLMQAHVVSAFEQSLSNMTHRLQQLAANTDQKVIYANCVLTPTTCGL